MPVQIVCGERSNGRVYIHESHIYHVTRKFPHIVHLKCIFDGCESSAVYCEGDEYLRLIKEHSHEPDREEEDRLLFRQALRDDATQTTLEFDDIYFHHSARYPYGASIITLSDAKSLMRRARDSRVPPTPLSLEEMATTLCKPEWKGWSLCMKTREVTFFKKAITVGGTALLFQSPNVLSEISDENELFIGFIRAMPRYPATLKSTLVIGFFKDKEGQTVVIPWAFILMEEAYYHASECLQGNPGARVHASSIVCDYNSALRSAVGTVWPLAVVSSSLFLICEDLYEKLVECNLHNTVERNLELFRKSIAAAVLMPNGIADALHLLVHESRRTSLEAFLELVQSTWVDLLGVEVLSCHDTPRSKDAAVKGFYFNVVKTITTGHPRPTAWEFIGALRSFVQSPTYGPDAPARRRNRPNLRIDVQGQYLSTLVNNFTSGQIPVQAYLERAEHILKPLVKTVVSLHRMRRIQSSAPSPVLPYAMEAPAPVPAAPADAVPAALAAQVPAAAVQAVAAAPVQAMVPAAVPAAVPASAPAAVPALVAVFKMFRTQ